MSKLTVTNLCKSFAAKNESQRFDLCETSFSVEEGKLPAIIGPSGCGKTTLLRCLAGLTTPDRGSVSVDGVELTAVPAESRGFGMIFQQAYLFPHLTVGENIAFGLKMRGISSIVRQAETKQILEAVDLRGFDQRMPDTLSGGQQQRVALARALILNPKVLLLDEPFSALDPLTRIDMRELVKSLQQRFNMTIVMVTHDREEAFEMADQLAVMDQGKMIQMGSPFQLYTTPISTKVAALVGCKNLLHGQRVGSSFHFKDLAFPAFMNTQENTGNDASGVTRDIGFGTLMIRTEAIQLNGHDYSAIIHRVRSRPGNYQVCISISGCLLDLQLPYGEGNVPKEGEQVGVSIDWSKTYWIPDFDESDVKTC